MIEIPKVWFKFGLCIYQDFFSVHPEFDEGILFALEGLESSEKHELISFIDHTLHTDPTNQYLIDLWGKSGASDILASDQMHNVYKALLEIIQASIKI